MKQILKKLIPTTFLKSIRPMFHGLKGFMYAAINFFPATKLKVIGITGTKGKTSTTVMTGRLMNSLGYKTGFVSTALFYDGQDEVLNYTKMTSIDAKILQSMLRKMVNNGCKYVVVEMSSQGLEQNRHKGLFGFDTTVFLNIYPEHIEAHGSFEIYRDAKGVLFKNLRKGGQAIFNCLPEFKEHSDYYINKYTKLFSNKKINVTRLDNTFFKLKSNNNSQFNDIEIFNSIFKTNLTTDFEIDNLAFGIKAMESTVNDNSFIERLPKPLLNIKTIPGRLEYVVKNNENLANGNFRKNYNNTNIDIMVDYAHETGSMERLLSNLASWREKGYYDSIIHVLSCDGVGRDDWKKPILGEISNKYANFMVVTTDNYEAGDNPQTILDMLTEKLTNNIDKFVKIVDRKTAMIHAIRKAQEIKGGKVLIVSTGVGAEQQLTQPSGLMTWDERKIWSMLFDEYC